MPLLSSLVLAGISATAADFPSEPVVFVSDRDGDADLYLVTVGEDDPRQITNAPGHDGWPRWSPDGKRIAFHREVEGRSDLYVIDRDGSNERRLTELENAFDPAWSPDGRSLVFRVQGEHRSGLRVLELSTGDVRVLTDTAASDWGPDWSPDGKWIAFATYAPGNEDIVRIRPDGTERENLTSIPGEDSLPRYSPDGKRIAFCPHPDGPSTEVFVMGADGQDPKRLTSTSRENTHAANFAPAWSFDGAWIVFTSRRDGNNELYLMRADGSDVRRLTDHEGSDTRADWAPAPARPAGGSADTPVPARDGRDDSPPREREDAAEGAAVGPAPPARRAP